MRTAGTMSEDQPEADGCERATATEALDSARRVSFGRGGVRCEADGQRRGRDERERGTNGRPQRGAGENRERYGFLARRAGLKSGKAGERVVNSMAGASTARPAADD